MREGYYLKSNENHLYLLDSKRRPIECLTNLIENFNHINIFNGTGEMSFVIYYSDETKHIYNAFIEKMTHLRLEDYGEFIVDTAPENIQGEVRYKTVTCKDEEYMLNKRLLTLVNNTASFFSGVLWTTDTSVPCVMREFFNEVPSWSIGTVDSEIDNTKKSFRDIKKQNMLKFVYENIEQAFDCIPFFNSLNRTISFRKTKNAIDDTGIVIALSNFIDSIVKESINDTFCTRMYTEGGNLDIRRVNPDGRNYVYYYDTFYNLMSDELVSHLKNYLKAINDNKAVYQTAFAEWSEAKTKYDEASVIMKSTDAEMTRWNDRYFILDKNGASQEEKDVFFQQWEDWQHSSGRWNAADVMSAQSPIVASKKVVLDNINSICNVKNFLTTSDFIELDQFETEGSYKQEAFAYIKGMSEAEKGDIAQILKTYATEEIARCNSPRYTYNVSLSNFCTIEGCEYFAESLDVGKYITLYDDVTGQSVKLIVVKIETDKENPKDLKLTFSDKMTGHEKFATLNEYLNNAIKNMDDIEKTNVRIDEIETVVDSVINKQEVLETSVNTLYENYQASSFNIETYNSKNLQTTSKNPIGAINEVFQSTTDAFNLFKGSIISKGGTVTEPINKTNINNGILSISNTNYDISAILVSTMVRKQNQDGSFSPLSSEGIECSSSFKGTSLTWQETTDSNGENITTFPNTSGQVLLKNVPIAYKVAENPIQVVGAKGSKQTVVFDMMLRTLNNVLLYNNGNDGTSGGWRFGNTNWEPSGTGEDVDGMLRLTAYGTAFIWASTNNTFDISLYSGFEIVFDVISQPMNISFTFHRPETPFMTNDGSIWVTSLYGMVPSVCTGYVYSGEFDITTSQQGVPSIGIWGGEIKISSVKLMKK